MNGIVSLCLAGTTCLINLQPHSTATHSPSDDAAPSTRLVQRLDERPSPLAEALASEHFELRFDPARVSNNQALTAREVAERAWTHCSKLFGITPEGRITLDLTPRFDGATGFARPGEFGAKDAGKRPFVGVRYADLDYLGLTADYVITHEVAHVFSGGELAGSSFGEGIADWGAGTFAGMPMRPWFGKALREAGLWIEPEAFFVTGEFEANTQVNPVIRTAQYAESGLMVRYLVDRFGWEKFKRFAADFSKERGPLISNSDRRRIATRRRSSPEDQAFAAPPKADVIRATFERHFGEPWNRLRQEWERQMSEDAAPAGGERKLVLTQTIYGNIRNWEMWAGEQRPAVSDRARQAIRGAFTAANRRLCDGDEDGAARELAKARAMVEELRHPRVITDGGMRKQTFAANGSNPVKRG